MQDTSNHLQDHVEIIAKHEQEFLAERTPAERFADSLGAFIGSLGFVAIHLSWFIAWVIMNTVGVASIPRFDPAPFPLLDSIVAIEAIFLASFIVMRQSRIGRRADQRDHLILQILLLTEKEVTAALNIERQIARRLGLDEAAKSSELEQLSQQTSIDEVAQTLKDSLPTE